VEKSGPEEKVGVVGRVDGRLRVVEYSEMTEAETEARGDDGRLVYGAGNIAIHAIRRDFAERIAASGDLPFHLARKKVPCVDENGETVSPEAPNATKFERFVFDALPETEISVTMEVDRAEEFAPVKNAEGVDSPATARGALTDLFRRWYAAAGITFPPVTDAGGHLAIEIDPCFAADAETLRARLAESAS
jgi:UDP-N-acetylglucosamine/UDP-N-acetylgalactosamine diphosphorylase